MPSRYEQPEQEPPLTGEDLLLAVARVVREQRKIKGLQARRDQAAARLEVLLAVDQSSAAWPASPDNVPEAVKSEAEAVSLAYVLARQGVIHAIEAFGYPGRLNAKYLGLHVLVTAKDKAGSVIKVSLPHQHLSDMSTAREPAALTEVLGITTASPRIGEGMLRIIPDGSERGAFAEVSTLGEELQPLVNISVCSPEAW